MTTAAIVVASVLLLAGILAALITKWICEDTCVPTFYGWLFVLAMLLFWWVAALIWLGLWVGISAVEQIEKMRERIRVRNLTRKR